MQSTQLSQPQDIEILIVEDSQTQAEKLKYLIAGKGYRVRVASNGMRALEALNTYRPALILSDIVMPEMNGYQLCEAIKSSPEWHDIPVILVTSLTDSKDIIRGLECGADNFVRKPYPDNYLLTRIEHVLINQQLRRARNMEIGIALYLGGQKHFINSERQQILDLLISTYEQAVQVNEELLARERQVIELNMRLAQHAARLEETNRKIAQQNIELAQASRLKSEFLANMSHELRTPLNAIIGFSEVLRDGLVGNLSEQQQEYARDIFDSGKHLLSLIRDILDLSKIEAGKMELELEPTEIASLIEGGLVMLRERALTHNIQLRMEAEPLGRIQADQRKTKQILFNLLSNAVKFTPPDGRVTVSLKRVRPGQERGVEVVRPRSPVNRPAPEYVELAVSDQGIGINPDDLGRMFEPFVQIDSSLARKYEGTGLGLALVKKLVELHGGGMWVDSALGRGAAFVVWLPYIESAPAGGTTNQGGMSFR